MKIAKISWSVFILSLTLVACNKTNEIKSTAYPEYPTMVVEKQEVALESTYPATIKGQEDIEIRPRIDGFIDAIYVDEGSLVRKGKVLFKINSPQAEQNVTSAQAAVTSAQAQVNTAKTNVERIEPLTQKGIISNVQLETAKDSYQSALAGLAQAEAALKNAQAVLSWTNVTSPVDGIVGEIPYRIGSLVNSANLLTTVANIKNIFAYFSINEKELLALMNNLEGNMPTEKIKNLPPVTLIKADGSIYPDKGKIETISGVVNSTTGSVNFRAEFPNMQGRLRSGSSAKISIPSILSDAVLIPQKATSAQQDKIMIFKVEGDSVVQKTIDVIPTPDGKNYAVTSGLENGDRIVSDGVATLVNGKKISYK